jgi:phosphatidylglycerophosphatase A
MVGVLLYLAVRHFFWLQVALILALFFLGSILSSKAEQLFKERDSHRIVVDEVMGFLITMFGMGRVDWPILVVAFLLNRACDIWKPFPIRKLEDLPGGWGIMLDDFGAGIYSNMILRVILAIF